MLNARTVLRSNSAKAALLVLLSIALVSCETVGYYSQAARGQLTIVFGREDIQRLIEQQDLSTELAEKLSNAGRWQILPTHLDGRTIRIFVEIKNETPTNTKMNMRTEQYEMIMRIANTSASSNWAHTHFS